MKRVTIKEVAKPAEVSISTVSRYLADPTSINPVSAKNVSKAIKEFNYIPNPFAQNLKSESTNVIAIIMPNIANAYFSEVCKTMCSLFYEEKYLVMICDCDNNPERERYYIDEMIRNRVAGLMISSSGSNGQYLQDVVADGHRVVLFDQMELSVDTDTVNEHNLLSSYNLTQAMVNQGHRRFVILNGPTASANMHFRLLGVKKALEEVNLTPEEKYVFSDLIKLPHVSSVMETLLKDKNAPRCIIANNPILLEHLVYTIKRLGLSVPDEYSVGGFAVRDPRYYYPIPVTAILQQPTEVGLCAGELMLKRLRNKEKKFTPKQIMIPTKLIL